jgi:hypothetical protein
VEPDQINPQEAARCRVYGREVGLGLSLLDRAAGDA